eukprot:scaffold70118_cov32-Tisochrysis_lutea.AAC.4
MHFASAESETLILDVSRWCSAERMGAMLELRSDPARSTRHRRERSTPPPLPPATLLPPPSTQLPTLDCSIRSCSTACDREDRALASVDRTARRRSARRTSESAAAASCKGTYGGRRRESMGKWRPPHAERQRSPFPPPFLVGVSREVGSPARAGTYRETSPCDSRGAETRV